MVIMVGVWSCVLALAVCPVCLATARAGQTERLRAAEAAYGKVPVAEYERLHDAAHAPVDEGSLETLAEYYEVGVGRDGTFTVNYGAECDVCGLEHRFWHSGPVTPPDRR